MKKSVDIKFKYQKHFPWLDEYKAKFPITDGTIFVYKDIIYTNNEMPYDILAHEIRHLQQQQQIGAKEWHKKFLTDGKFRLTMELDAIKAQMQTVKKTNDKDEYNHILVEAIETLSSDLYGNIITRQEAIKLLKKI